MRAGRLVLERGGAFEVDPAAYGPEARLAELDRTGLERAVVSLPPTTEPTPDLVELWHDEALGLARETNGRLIPLAYDDAVPGFSGAIVSARTFASTSLLAQLQARGQLAFVHPGPAAPVEPAWRTPGVTYANQMLDAYAWWLAVGARRFPGLRVVFALLGGGAAFQIERFVRRGLDARVPFAANAWFETSSYGERALELSLQTFGAGRLVFGSDAPVDPVADALATLARFGPALELELLVSTPLALLTAERHRWAA